MRIKNIFSYKIKVCILKVTWLKKIQILYDINNTDKHISKKFKREGKRLIKLK